MIFEVGILPKCFHMHNPSFFADDFFFLVTIIYVIDICIRWFGLGFASFRANGWNIFDVIVAMGALATTLVINAGSQSFIVEQLQKLFLVSIAFKLIQRTNSMNQLFKTAMCDYMTAAIL